MRATYLLLRCLRSTCLVAGVALLSACGSSVEYGNTPGAYTVKFESTSALTNEDSGSVTATLVLSREADKTMSVPLSTLITDPEDRCHLATGSVTFSLGESQKSFVVCHLADNAEYQGPSSMKIGISAASAIPAAAPSAFQVTVNDDEAQPLIGFTTATTTKNENDVTTFQITMTLSMPTATALLVPFTVTGTALEGSDYVLTPIDHQVTFAPGETTKEISITVSNESTNTLSDEEPDETIIITPQAPGLWGLDPTAPHVVTIVDNDRPTASISAVTASEGTIAAFTVTLNRISSRPVSFDYATLDGTATGGNEYTPMAGTGTVPAGASSTVVPVPILRVNNPAIIGKTLSIQINSYVNAANVSPLSATATLDRSLMYVPLVADSQDASLQPVRSAGSVSAHFDRAATAYVRDFEGRLQSAQSGEARFSDMRRIQNIAIGTDDPELAPWTAGTGVTMTGNLTGPNSTTGEAASMDYNGAGTAAQDLWSQSFASGQNENLYVFSVSMRSSTPVTTTLFIGVDSAPVVIAGDNTWRRYAISTAQVGDGAIAFGIREGNSNAAITALEIYGPMMENVTTQSLQAFRTSTDLIPSGYVKRPAVDPGDGSYGVVYRGKANGNTLDTSTRVVTEADGAEFTAPRGLLLEGPGENMILYTDDFNNSIWTRSGGAAVVSTAGLSPVGARTATELGDTGAAFATICQSTLVANDASTYTFSIFAKRNVAALATFGVNLTFSGGSTPLSADAKLNLVHGTASTIGGAVSVENFGDWDRLSVTLANNTSGHTQLSVCLFPAAGPNGSSSNQPSVTGEVLVWGPQVEMLPFATSYIASIGTKGTRPGDSLWYDPPTGFSVASAYTVAAQTKLLGLIFATSCVTTNNCQLLLASDSSSAPYLRLASGSANSAVGFGTASVLTSLSTVNLADSVKLEESFYVGRRTATTVQILAPGAKGPNATAGSAPSAPSRLYVGSNAAGNWLFGHVRGFEIWTRALGESEAAGIHR